MVRRRPCAVVPLLLLAGLVGCADTRAPPPEATRALADPGTAPLEVHPAPGATLWVGVRRDGEDGSEAPMTLRERPILAGKGYTAEIEVTHAGGTYRGFSVVVLDERAGHWVLQYVNEPRTRFVRLETEGTVPDVFRSVDPARTRESRLELSPRDPDRWLRTQRVSDDGGATWRILWQDELHRVTAR